MLVKDCEIRIVRSDITKLTSDAIVNAANNMMVMGGGVAGAIKKAGGASIEEEALKKGPVALGEAVYTKAGSLSAGYVIHAATMGMDFKTDEYMIRASCMNALLMADRLKIKSIVFPALGCGAGGFGLSAAAKIMSQEVLKYLRSKQHSLKEITFCLYDKEAYEVFDKTVTGYLRHFVEDMADRPFTTVDAIVEVPGGVVIIERSNPPFGLALPGGFVDYGESLEAAVARELMEETSLEVSELRQFHTYSDPARDPRFHTIGTVFTAKSRGTPKAGDDAASVRVIRPDEIRGLDFAFDHKKILKDYLRLVKGENPF